MSELEMSHLQCFGIWAVLEGLFIKVMSWMYIFWWCADAILTKETKIVSMIKLKSSTFTNKICFFRDNEFMKLFLLHFQPNLACKIARNQTFEVKSSLCINRGWTKKRWQTVLFKSGSNVLGQSASSVKISC